MSVGTLLAFTVVAISILILRYVPPNEVPLPSSFHESIHSVSSRYNFQEKPEEIPQDETYSVRDDGANISLLVNEVSYGNYWVVSVRPGPIHTPNNVASANVIFPYSLLLFVLVLSVLYFFYFLCPQLYWRIRIDGKWLL